MPTHKRLGEFVVIGSGPSGWASLEALVAQGETPVLIDIHYTDDETSETSGGHLKSEVGFSQKIRFGKSYMYDYPSDYLDVGSLRKKVPLSGAFGGLSTVWGSNLQLCHDACGRVRDPEQSDYVRAATEVLDRMFHCGESDDLDVVARWPVRFQDKTPQSMRMQNIQYTLKSLFQNENFVAGMARNATRGERSGCIACGKCMTGCDSEAIFSTEKRVRELIDSGKVHLVRGIVETIQRDDSYVIVNCSSVGKRENFTVAAHTVFLAAGAIASAAILMRSRIVGQAATLQETQVSYLPILVPRMKSTEKSRYSLSQVFIESRRGISAQGSFHMSLYEPSDDWPDRLRAVRPFLGRLFARIVERSVIVGICFLPSSESGKLELHLGNDGVVSVFEKRLEHTLRTFKKRLRDLRRLLWKEGIIPLVEFAEFPNVGASFHVGALESEGAPSINEDGLTSFGDGLYVIDGAALRIVPTGPVTLSIMVNATMVVNRLLATR